MCERINERARDSWRHPSPAANSSQDGPTVESLVDHLVLSALSERGEHANEAQDDEAWIAAAVRVHLERRAAS